MRQAITLTIPDERAPGWNSTMRMHWARRDALVGEMWLRVRPAMPATYAKFDCVVDVHVAATFKGTPLDSDNVCAKLYIDVLKGKLLHDDNARYLRRVTTESRHGKTNSVTITLTPVEEQTA